MKGVVGNELPFEEVRWVVGEVKRVVGNESSRVKVEGVVGKWKWNIKSQHVGNWK